MKANIQRIENELDKGKIKIQELTLEIKQQQKDMVLLIQELKDARLAEHGLCYLQPLIFCERLFIENNQAAAARLSGYIDIGTVGFLRSVTKNNLCGISYGNRHYDAICNVSVDTIKSMLPKIDPAE